MWLRSIDLRHASCSRSCISAGLRVRRRRPACVAASYSWCQLVQVRPIFCCKPLYPPYLPRSGSTHAVDDADLGFHPAPPDPNWKYDTGLGGLRLTIALVLMQAVDLPQQLAARGFSEAAAAQYLDASPPVAFSVYYGGRSDCNAEVQVRRLFLP